MTSPATTRYPDYAAVARLPEAGLRALLAGGDAAERIWAAWALGVRVGRRAVAQTREVAR
jgi:hypothetical protein